MQLDRLSAVMRPRNPWEAIDLGIVMARAWWWRLTLAWLMVSLPPFLVLQWVLQSHPLWAIAVVWWLKPLWERAPLFILSRGLFGEAPGLRQTLRAFPSLAAKQWFPSLTYRRLSLTRSMDLPVVTLENLSGAERAKRLAILHRTGSDGSIWLTSLAASTESLLYLSVWLVLYLLIPQEWSEIWRGWFSGGYVQMGGVFNTVFYACMTAVAPFYVSAGFALYLNRRTWLEGWDIEIGFRRLAQRLAARGAVQGVVLVLTVSLVMAGLWSTPAVAAHEQANFSRDDAQQVIAEVLARDTFHDKKTLEHPKWPKWWKTSKNQDIDPGIPQWLIEGVQWVARSAELILWVAVIALVLLFAHKYRDWLFRLGGARRVFTTASVPSKAVVHGMAISEEPLPEDVLAEVRRLWQAQQFRAALALLFRATLARLRDGHGVKLHDSCTELECGRLVEACTPPELSGYFNELTRHWLRLAYGHRVPEAAVVEELCHRWKVLFGQEKTS